MAFVPDYTKTPREIMFDLLNEAGGGIPITDLLVDIGPPVVPSSPATPRETEITITAVEGSGIAGQKTMKYNRVDLAVVPGVRSIQFDRGVATRILDLIPAINAAYDLNLQPEDYVDAVLPTGAVGQWLDFTLQAGSLSYCFVGSVVLKVSA